METQETLCIRCQKKLAPEYPWLCQACLDGERRQEDYVDESDRDFDDL
jgi:hypothetical protein